jgi:hypothetical protein
MKLILLLAASGISLVSQTASAQERGPSDFDPRPLALALGVDEPITFERETLSMLQAQPASSRQEWHFDFMLYGLFGNLYGDLTARGHEADVDIGAQQFLDNLQFTAAGRARLQHKTAYLALDIFYMGLDGSSGSPPVAVTFDQWIVQPTVGFSLSDRLDVFFGARYNQLNGDLSFQGPLGKQAVGLQEWWDPIVGAIFKGRMSEKFGYQIYVDVGGFSVGSKFTAKLEPMISWYFSKHASFDLAYQAYYVDYADTAEGFADQTVMYGPLVGLSVHF